MYNALSSECKTLVSITGGSHCQFAEQNFYCGLGEIGVPDPLVDREPQHTITNQFLLPWFDCTLRGNVSAFYEFEDSLLTCDAATFLHECTTVPPRPLVIASVTNEEATIALVWSPVAFSSPYSVYRAPNPFASSQMWHFEDIIPMTSWTATLQGNARLYAVAAVR